MKLVFFQIILISLLSLNIYAKNDKESLDSIFRFYLKLKNPPDYEGSDITNEYIFNKKALEKLNLKKKETEKLLLKSAYYTHEYKMDSAYFLLNNFLNKNKIDLIQDKAIKQQFAYVYMSLGYFEKAVEYYEKARNIEIAITLDDLWLFENLRDEYYVDYQLSNCYIKLNDYKNARRVLAPQIKDLDEIFDPNKLGRFVQVYSNVMLSEGKYEETKDFLSNYLYNENYIRNPLFGSYFFTAIAYTESVLGNYKSAIDYQLKATEIREEKGNTRLLMNAYVSLANFYLLNNQVDSASYYFDLSDNLFANNNNLLTTLHYFRNIINYYEISGDSVALNKTRLILNLVEEKEKLIKRIIFSSDQVIDQKESLQKVESNYKIALLFVGVFILLAVIIIFFLRKAKIAEKDLIKKQSKLKESISSHIDTQKNLEVLINQKNSLIGLISHDLINPLVASERLLKMSLEIIDDNPDLYEINESIYKSIKQNKLLLNEIMLMISQSNFGLSRGKSKVAVFRVIGSVYENLKPQLEEKFINFENKIPSKLFIYTNQDYLQVILRNLIQNAIKFTPSEGKIVVDSYTDKKNIYLTVQDNGEGIEEKKLINLFDSNRLMMDFKTESNQGHGFGLIICKELITLSGGDIFVDSELGKGTKFTISLPNYEES